MTPIGAGRAGGRPPPQLFVAHPFTERGRLIVQSLVLPCLRRHELSHVVPRHTRSPDVGADLCRTIERCAGLVGVVIGRSPNVFFEIGCAFALGKPCLLLADREDELGMLAGDCPAVLISTPEATGASLSHLLRRWRCALAPCAP